jgi:hypothetical protein
VKARESKLEISLGYTARPILPLNSKQNMKQFTLFAESFGKNKALTPSKVQHYLTKYRLTYFISL